MSATHTTDSTTPSASVLYMAFELGWTSWKLAFTVGAGQKPRIRPLPARSLVGLMLEIRKAKQRFGLPDDAPVVSCYEAGRDGFWLHRFLTLKGGGVKGGGVRKEEGSKEEGSGLDFELKKEEGSGLDFELKKEEGSKGGGEGQGSGLDFEL